MADIRKQTGTGTATARDESVLEDVPTRLEELDEPRDGTEELEDDDAVEMDEDDEEDEDDEDEDDEDADDEEDEEDEAEER